MRRILVVLGVLFCGALLACESVVGVDYGAYRGECNPTSDQCPNPKHGCYYNGSAFACRASASDTRSFGSCTSETQCIPSEGCQGNDKWNTQHCLPYCTGDADCYFGGHCIQFNTPIYSRGTQIGACAGLDTPCDPRAGTTECTSQSARCMIFDKDLTFCFPFADKVVNIGDPCSNHTECPAGSICFQDISGNAFCRQSCTIGQSDCMNGSCRTYGSRPAYKGQEIGVCY